MLLAQVDPANLWGAIGAGVVVLLALLKVSRQAGRIEEGVKGLYDRVQRIEDVLYRRSR